MSSNREELIRRVNASSTPEERVRELSRFKARVTTDAWKGFQGKGMEGVAHFRTRKGQAQIGHIEFHENDNVSWVDVWMGVKKGNPAYRIVNPPTLVEDSQGPIEIPHTLPSGRVVRRRYREDPVQAIAEAIGGGESEG